ncbi:pyridoxal phosphate-dependent aminotransferase [Microlunatus soli]|uniref:Aminotransferase n=1 Tax=Microlunatus soli TaxID=630515 RepID=A0A1H1VV30_9ACTN|nr:pyridoxal phosphate-dependent aminotransferase [Microlunatus soli]SDS88747.1 aspartate aminotransferase [Microlunatus soli]
MLTETSERRPPAAAVPASSLHAAFRSAEQWESRHGRRAIKLQVGEPAYPMPTAVREAMAAAVRAGDCAYTSAEGSVTLRDALAARLNGHGLDTDPERVFVTPGSCQGLWAVLTSIVTPGAAVLIPELHWPIYRQQAILTGFTPIGYPLRADYTPDPDGIAAAAASIAAPGGGTDGDRPTRVAAIIVNSPANPTGAITPVDDLARILELADRHDWAVISDEAYQDFVYRGRHSSTAALEADRQPAARRVFSTFSFSKSHAMTGCRVGYVTAPDSTRADVLRRVQESCIIAPPTPAQRGAMAGLATDREVEANATHVHDNLAAVAGRLSAAGMVNNVPAGGWYALLDVTESGLDAGRFAERLLEDAGVAVAPAAAFALPGDDRSSKLIRISLAGDRAELTAGVDAIIAQHRAGGVR